MFYDEWKQVKFKFDDQTIRKIVIGAVHAAFVAAFLFGLQEVYNILVTVQFNNPFLNAGLAWVVQAGYNAGRQWAKGE